MPKAVGGRRRRREDRRSWSSAAEDCAAVAVEDCGGRKRLETVEDSKAEVGCRSLLSLSRLANKNNNQTAAVLRGWKVMANSGNR